MSIEDIIALDFREAETMTVSQFVDFFNWLTEQGHTKITFFDDCTRYAAVTPMIFTSAIVVGETLNRHNNLGHYHYASETEALAALHDWDGTGDPTGYVAKKGF